MLSELFLDLPDTGIIDPKTCLYSQNCNGLCQESVVTVIDMSSI